jgi:hypothetical protein
MRGRLNSAVHTTIKLTFTEIPTSNQDLLSKQRTNVRSWVIRLTIFYLQ